MLAVNHEVGRGLENSTITQANGTSNGYAQKRNDLLTQGDVAVHSYTAWVTPEMASEWLNTYKYEHQRGVRKAHLKRYVKAMRDGLWQPGTQIKVGMVIGEPGGYILDGQHRLLAVVETGIPQLFSITELVVPDGERLGPIYYTTDRNSVRTKADMFRVARLGEHLGLTNAQLNAVSAAVTYIMRGMSRGSHESDGRIAASLDDLLKEEILKRADAVDNYMDAIAGAPKLPYRALLRAPVIAIGITTFHEAVSIYGEDKVTDFWTGIALDDGLAANDPRKLALRHLLFTRLSTNRNVGGVQGVSADYQARYIANCWNAWTEGRTLERTRVADASAPISINGTSFNGS